jgi:hypothetical protein
MELFVVLGRRGRWVMRCHRGARPSQGHASWSRYEVECQPIIKSQLKMWVSGHGSLSNVDPGIACVVGGVELLLESWKSIFYGYPNLG